MAWAQKKPISASILIVIAAIVAGWVYRATHRPKPDPTPAPTTLPTTMPATQPTTPAVVPVQTFLQVIRAADPHFPTTRPLEHQLPLRDAAHLILHDPIYLCPRGDLWIARPDADELQAVLDRAADEQVHVLRERPAYVHWTLSDRSQWEPQLVLAEKEQWILRSREGGQVFHSAQRYHWNEAFSWNQRIVVPTDRGISILNPANELSEQAIALADESDPSPVQALVVMDGRGLIAWTAYDGKRPSHAARYVESQWHRLDDRPGWPDQLLHLVPLLDGSLLQLIAGPNQTVQLAMTVLDAAPVDEARLAKLVAELSADEAPARLAAFTELNRYGPGIWPYLEKLAPTQPPEAKIRIQQLLHNRQEPTLGGMVPVQDQLQLVNRQAFGAAVFYAPAGVSLPQPSGSPQVISPAWIWIRPGFAIELLPPAVLANNSPQNLRWLAFGNEVIVCDSRLGPRRLAGNHLMPILRKDEAAFSEPLGIDRRGRWLFHVPNKLVDTLVIDPTLPDPTPRLPVWQIDVAGGQVGWDADNWPAIRRGGGWTLRADGWKAMGSNEQLIHTLPAPADSGACLLTAADGSRYFDGQEALIRIDPDGRKVRWPLPAQATGIAPAHLLQTPDGLLYLFNQAGRLLRIRPGENDKEPFRLEATFTRRIPNTDRPDRIWLDPAGRIVWATPSSLFICFPAGRIPAKISSLIPADQLEAED